MITARELAQTRAADVWLWPSLYSFQLLACVQTRTRALVSGCIHHPPNFFSPREAGWWRYGFLQANAAEMRVRVGAVEPETRHCYLPLSDGAIRLFPFPGDSSPAQAPRQCLRRIGVFGFQRPEKGESFLRPLFLRLQRAGYALVFQDSNRQNDRYRDISGVTHLGYVEDINVEIAKCDLVLAPYDPHAYQYRGSGIVIGAIAHGVPVITSEGSAPGRLVERTGAGVLFPHYSVDSIYKAIQWASDHYASIANSAYQSSSQWRDNHGIEKFLEAAIT